MSTGTRRDGPTPCSTPADVQIVVPSGAPNYDLASSPTAASSAPHEVLLISRPAFPRRPSVAKHISCGRQDCCTASDLSSDKTQGQAAALSVRPLIRLAVTKPEETRLPTTSSPHGQSPTARGRSCSLPDVALSRPHRPSTRRASQCDNEIDAKGRVCGAGLHRRAHPRRHALIDNRHCAEVQHCVTTVVAAIAARLPTLIRDDVGHFLC